jgi:hypothetical protein
MLPASKARGLLVVKRLGNGMVMGVEGAEDRVEEFELREIVVNSKVMVPMIPG